jgi:hypothetical protein
LHERWWLLQISLRILTSIYHRIDCVSCVINDIWFRMHIDTWSILGNHASCMYWIKLHGVMLWGRILCDSLLLIPSILSISIVHRKPLFSWIRCVYLPLQIMHAHQIHLIFRDSHQILSIDSLEVLRLILRRGIHRVLSMMLLVAF